MRLVLIAAGLGLFVSLLGTPLLIKFLRRHHLAQAIRVSTAGEPYPEHEGKRGTPSMGGLIILAGLLIGYLGAHIVVAPPSWSGSRAVPDVGSAAWASRTTT
jgi:phospho-N-acetylmuramoyl-pentapeptide-transferase